MPYQDESFDNIFCLEVLEHCENPEQVIREIERIVKPKGAVVISIPFAVKWHMIPHDYWRWTPSGLKKMFSKLERLKLKQTFRRGTDFTVIFHTTASALTGFLFRKSILMRIAGVFLFPLAYMAGLLANLSEVFDFGASENNIGFICILEKD
jgi:SAM-dependent methyltransferase